MNWSLIDEIRLNNLDTQILIWTTIVKQRQEWVGNPQFTAAYWEASDVVKALHKERRQLIEKYNLEK